MFVLQKEYSARSIFSRGPRLESAWLTAASSVGALRLVLGRSRIPAHGPGWWAGYGACGQRLDAHWVLGLYSSNGVAGETTSYPLYWPLPAVPLARAFLLFSSPTSISQYWRVAYYL